jgi:AcrR family transcriptional regulator
MKKRDAKATKKKIIKEAKLLFSKKGFDATTIDDIASACGVNKALIYYYFQNKSGLYSEVMSGLFDAIYDEVKAAQKTCNTTLEELEVFVKTYAHYADNQPYFPALLLRELSDSGAHLPEIMFASMRKVYTLLSTILKKGEQEGIFSSALPMITHFMIIGGINLMITTQNLRKKAMQVDENVDTCYSCSVDEIADYVFHTIKKSLEVK